MNYGYVISAADSVEQSREYKLVDVTVSKVQSIIAVLSLQAILWNRAGNINLWEVDVTVCFVTKCFSLVWKYCHFFNE